MELTQHQRDILDSDFPDDNIEYDRKTMEAIQYINQFGNIFKEVTGRTTIPDSPQEIWEEVKRTRGLREDLNGKRYDSNLVTPSGNIFPIVRTPIDIDKHMRKL